MSSPQPATTGSLILMYHRVGNPMVRSIVRQQYAHPFFLRWQCQDFRDLGYKPSTLRDMMTRPDGFTGYFAPTFDDGFDDVWRLGLPIFEEFGVKATLFMVAGGLGLTNEWDVKIGDRAEKLLTAEHLKELAAAGWEIGSHTMSHPRLNWLSPAGLRAEFVDSKHLLEDLIGQPVVSLAYPYGIYDQRIRDAAAEAGYLYSVTCNQSAITPTMDPLLLPRMNMRWNTAGPVLTGKVKRLTEMIAG